MNKTKRMIQAEIWVYRKQGGVIKLENKNLSDSTLKAIQQDAEKYIQGEKK